MNAIARLAPDIRDSARRNMLLSALLRRGSDQAPVQIRNMSALGALIDSPVVPEPNSKVELIRGSYVAQGRVVWSEAKRCGIRFTSELSVNDWLVPIEAQPRTKPTEPSSPPCSEPSEPHTFATVEISDLLMAAKLAEQTARALTGDPHFLRDHMTEGRSLLRLTQLLSQMCEEAGRSS